VGKRQQLGPRLQNDGIGKAETDKLRKLTPRQLLAHVQRTLDQRKATRKWTQRKHYCSGSTPSVSR
jgi:hypothetical protein